MKGGGFLHVVVCVQTMHDAIVNYREGSPVQKDYIFIVTFSFAYCFIHVYYKIENRMKNYSFWLNEI